MKVMGFIYSVLKKLMSDERSNAKIYDLLDRGDTVKYIK